jgi:putative oxidoreductase
MNTTTRTNSAILLTRLTLGSVLLAHGLLKFLVFTLPGTAGFFASVGFPGWTAYIVAPLEVLAGVAMIAGVHSRVFALLTLPVQVGAGLVHLGNGWLFSNAKGGWEFPAVLVALTVIVILLGDGAYSVRRAAGDRSLEPARA